MARPRRCGLGAQGCLRRLSLTAKPLQRPGGCVRSLRSPQVQARRSSLTLTWKKNLGPAASGPGLTSRRRHTPRVGGCRQTLARGRLFSRPRPTSSRSLASSMGDSRLTGAAAGLGGSAVSLHVVTFNVNCVGNLIDFLKTTDAHLVLAQELRVLPAGLTELQTKLARLGWKSVVQPAVVAVSAASVVSGSSLVRLLD